MSHKDTDMFNYNLLNCPICGASLPVGSVFCYKCGVNLAGVMKQREDKMKSGELPLVTKIISTPFGNKEISVLCQDVTKYEGKIDLLTISAASYSYIPILGTLIEALETEKGIVVEQLAEEPTVDFRELGHCWVSDELYDDYNIRRIGCVERERRKKIIQENKTCEESILDSLRTYFHVLDLLADTGMCLDTVVMPILGAGSLHMDDDLLVYPMVNEAISALRRNPAIKQIIFMERSYVKAEKLAACIKTMYQLKEDDGTVEGISSKNQFVFISYTNHGDYEIAEKISSYLTQKGIDNWFAPKDIRSGAYAEKIVEGIEKSTHFICIISEESMKSEHVLNEIDLAFQHVSDGMVLLPFRVDEQELKNSFKYYLSRMNWAFGNPPPIDERIKEFIDKIFGEA